MKKYLPFDSGTLFIPRCDQWKKSAIAATKREYSDDMLRIHTIAQCRKGNPFLIPSYFGLKAMRDADKTFDLIGDIQMQVYEEMLALTGETYKLDWSTVDGAFCLWYLDKNQRINTMCA